MKNFLMNFLIVTLTVLVLWACSTPSTESNKIDPPQIPITVQPVIRMDMQDTVSLFGTLHLRKEAKIASQFDGRLNDFNLLPGEYVKKGQQIGVIIPPAREALLQTLGTLPAESRKDIEKQIKAIPLLSPIEGIVLEVIRHTGDVVQKGDQIIHIGDLRVLDIRGDLPVRYLPAVRKVRKIIVSFVNYPHKAMLLPVEAISGKVDKINQTAMIRLKLLNPKNEFYPGMVVKLSFIEQTHKKTLVIPRKALLEKEGIFSVFVLKEGKVEKRILNMGILQKNFVEVLSGLDEGEQVAVGRAYSLTDGMEVIVE